MRSNSSPEPLVRDRQAGIGAAQKIQNRVGPTEQTLREELDTSICYL